jgi:hypothetical protein
MKLTALTIKNFKGIYNFSVIMGGGDFAISGPNGAGKTRIIDAYMWLLTGLDSRGQGNFEIRSIVRMDEYATDERYHILHNIESSVEAIFETAPMTELTLKKVYREVYTKPRGTAKKVYSGNTVDHFVDGVPVQKKEYETSLHALIDQETIRILSTPGYFSNDMPWEKRRALLFAIGGELTVEEVVEKSNEDLSAVPDILVGRPVEAMKKVLKAQQKEGKEQVDQLPARIDEAALKVGAETEESINQKIELQEYGLSNMAAHIKELYKGREDITQGHTGPFVEERKGLQAKLDRFNAQDRQARELHRQNMEKWDFEVFGKESEQRSQARHMDKLKTREVELVAINDKLLGAWKNEEAMPFEYVIQGVCEACGEDISETTRTAREEKAKEAFHKGKANVFEAIKEAGEDNRRELDENTADIIKTKAKIKALDLEMLELHKNKPVLDAQEAPKEIMNRIAQLDSLIEASKENDKPALDEINAEIEETQAQAKAVQESFFGAREILKSIGRVKHLKKLLKDEAANLEAIEGKLFMLGLFEREKALLSEGNVNGMFKFARFKLFKIQKNGGIDTCCETTFEGVPYGTNLNKGARINVGLDIINTFSRETGKQMPVFVDNAESVTDLIKTDSQMITFSVETGEGLTCRMN